MKRLIFLAAALLLVLASLPAFAQGGTTLYASTGNAGSSLAEIDPGTGASTVIGSLGAFGPVTEIVQGDDGMLYGSTGGGASSFISIDPETAEETLIGIHPFGAINGMAFVDGTLYGSFFSPQGGFEAPEGAGGSPVTLVTIDPTTGQISEVGPIDAFLVRGMAYDPISGRLIAVGIAPNESHALFTIDAADGTTSVVTNFDPEIGGIRFAPDGRLIGGEAVPSGGGGEGPGGAFLVEIDPGTGAVTPIGDTGLPAISGLAFANAPLSIVEIPTASSIGLAVIALLLLASAWVMLRRRSLSPRA